MGTENKLRTRVSIVHLQDQYRMGNKIPLESLMRAWKGIKELPPDDPNSFFALAGLHGEPFRGAGWGNATYWGGYCNHGNILFPTWHRLFVLKLEEALRSVKGCEDVVMPFWDETEETGPEPSETVIPWSLTDPVFVLDGEVIPNPLKSFKLTQQITDNTANPNGYNYSKPLGYETVRYPLSGLVGADVDRVATKKHNAKFPNYEKNVRILNDNVKNWLGPYIIIHHKKDTKDANVRWKYIRCLDAPNYTVFSNTSSESQWNEDHPNDQVVALEDPHNDIHFAVGGFDWPGNAITPGQYFSPIDGANADMGENDTAAMDPIFYFHHCFVDYVFWQWQKRHGLTDHLDVMAQYPGTNSVDGQGPTPGVPPNSWLTLESKLDPWPNNSLGVLNIETQLGYTYGPGSLDQISMPTPPTKDLVRAGVEGRSTKIVHVSGINRGSIRGSFMISAFVTIGEERHHVGTKSILSRWNVQGCTNCQTHLEARAHFTLGRFAEESLETDRVEVEMRTRDGVITETHPAGPFPVAERKPFRFVVA
jgi:tyrosinase